MVELRFLIVELRYLGVDWDCLKISYDFKENLKIDFHQGNNPELNDPKKFGLFRFFFNFGPFLAFCTFFVKFWGIKILF